MFSLSFMLVVCHITKAQQTDGWYDDCGGCFCGRTKNLKGKNNALREFLESVMEDNKKNRADNRCLREEVLASERERLEENKSINKCLLDQENSLKECQKK